MKHPFSLYISLFFRIYEVLTACPHILGVFLHFLLLGLFLGWGANGWGSGQGDLGEGEACWEF